MKMLLVNNDTLAFVASAFGLNAFILHFSDPLFKALDTFSSWSSNLLEKWANGHQPFDETSTLTFMPVYSHGLIDVLVVVVCVGVEWKQKRIGFVFGEA
jgi:hypothetical protein